MRLLMQVIWAVRVRVLAVGSYEYSYCYGCASCGHNLCRPLCSHCAVIVPVSTSNHVCPGAPIVVCIKHRWGDI